MGSGHERDKLFSPCLALGQLETAVYFYIPAPIIPHKTLPADDGAPGGTHEHSCKIRKPLRNGLCRERDTGGSVGRCGLVLDPMAVVWRAARLCNR